jgi:UDP-N-acetylmuramate: L-alanyl-gamma-D-glutamyl-meso-diaminopimelate ligase
LVAAIQERGGRALFIPSVGAIVQDLAGRLGSGDRVVVFSNGGFGGIHEKLLSALDERAASGGAEAGAMV